MDTAILVCSALWLPLTARHLAEPSVASWWAIRAVLLAVGIGSTGIVWVCLRFLARERSALHWAALVGSLPFWLQTAVLDALIWPHYFDAP